MAEEEVTKSSVDAIENVDLDLPNSIPFELFAKKQNKTTQLVENTDPDRVMKGRHEWYKFPLNEPVFVTKISVFAEGYSYKKGEFRWRSMRQEAPFSKSVDFFDDRFELEINDIISEFNFKPDAKYIGGAKISSVIAEGFTIGELDRSLAQIADLEAARKRTVRSALEKIELGVQSDNRVAANEEKIKEQREQISTLETAAAEKVAISADLSQQIEEATKQVAELRTTQASLDSRIEQQNSTIEERTIERKKISEDIIKKTSELKGLENNIYLFPSEIKEFAEKAGKDKGFYWKLAAVPIIVVTAMALALLKNAADLTTVIDEKDNARLLSIFVTRLPYVAIAGAIIGVMFKIANSLVAEIMRIDNQTRSLAKISIIATDVSAASAEELELSDENLYHLRTGLKMDLLREHLKNYISQDYRYLDSDRVKKRRKLLRDDQRQGEDLSDSKAGDSEVEEDSSAEE